MNSAGSAMKENERYLDSIQGRIDLFTNSVQTFWMNAISSDFVKGIVDIGTTLMKVLDAITKKITIFGDVFAVVVGRQLVKTLMDKKGIKGISGLISTIGEKLSNMPGLKELTSQFKEIFGVFKDTKVFDVSKTVKNMVGLNVENVKEYADAIKSLTAEKQAEIIVNSGLDKQKQKEILTMTLGTETAAAEAMAHQNVTAAKVEELVATGTLTTDQAELIASTIGLGTAEGQTAIMTKQSALEKIKAAVATGGLTQADADASIAQLGLSGATTTGTLTFEAFTAAVIKATKALWGFLTTNPIGWAILAAAAIASVVAVYDAAVPHDEYVDKLEESSKELEDIRSELKSLNSELETTKQRIEELEGKGNLSFTEEEELKRLKAQSDELERQIALEEEREKRAAKRAAKDFNNAFESDTTINGTVTRYYDKNGNKVNTQAGTTYLTGEATSNTVSQQTMSILDARIEDYKKAKEEENQAREELLAFTKKNEDYEKTKEGRHRYNQLNNAFKTAEENAKSAEEALDSYYDTFNEYLNQEGVEWQYTENGKELKEWQKQMNDNLRYIYDYQDKIAIAFDSDDAKVKALTRIFGEQGYDAAQEFNESFSKEISQDIFYTLAEGTEYAQEWMNKLKETSPETAQELDRLGISAEDIAKYFIQVGEEAKKAASSVENSLSNIITDLSSFEKGLTDLSEAYNEFLEKGSTSASTFEDLKETFNVGDMTDEYENFVRVLGDSTSTIGEVEAAIESLVTAYFESLDLSNIVNEEDMAVVVDSLNKLGVKNAKELVASKTEAYKQISDLYNVDLQNFDNAEEAKIAIEQSKKNQITSLSAEEINELAEHYGVDVGNFKSAKEAKIWIENDLTNAVLTENADLIDQLADKYGIDLTNFDDMNQQKVESAKKAAKAIARANAIAEASKAYSNVIGEYSDRDDFDPNDIRQESRAIKKAGLAYDSIINSAVAEAEKKIDDIVFVGATSYDPNKVLSNYYKPIDLDLDKFKKLGEGSGSGSGSDSGSGNNSDNDINWVEVLFKRIDNALSEHEGNLATVIDSINGLDAKDDIYDAMLGQMYNKANSSLEAVEYYRRKAEETMSGLSTDIQNKIKNGDMSIQEFKSTGNEEADKALEEHVNKINQAIEYYDKISEYQQQYYSTVEEIANKALERQEETAKAYENEISLVEHLNDTLEARNNLEELKEGFATETYYKAQIDANNTILQQKKAERKALQQVFDAEVAAGNVPIGSQQWFDMQQAIYDCDDAIIDTESSIEELQNSINDLYWDRFDELINRFGYLEEEISNVIELLSHDPDGLIMEELRDLTSTNWATGSGLATLGLYAQQMEEAQYVANQYAEQIKELKKQYAAGRYNETDYLNKLNELINSQYESLEQYHDAKDAIVELNKARVDAIRDGIEKEIDAYSELIDKKKELLNKEQDLRDFQDEVAEKEKDVSDLRKQLAVMAGDDSQAAAAKRKKIEADLMAAQKSLEESYYSHSMSAREEALDQEFADFEESKNKEIESWENWLENTESIVLESLEYVKNNTNEVFTTLKQLGNDYNLTMSTELTTPWQNGSNAIDSYSQNFGTAVSNFTSQLDGIVVHWNSVTTAAEQAAKAQAAALQAQYNKTASTVPSTTTGSNNTSNNTDKPVNNTPVVNPKPAQKAITTGSKVKVASTDHIYSSPGVDAGKQYYRNDPVYIILGELNGYYKVRYHKLSSGVTGWFPKSRVSAYAKGTLGTKRDELALIDELGEELVLRADGSGKLSYLTKGSSVIPANITEKLMNIALDPTSILEDALPGAKVPNIETKDFNFAFNFDSLLHVDNATNDSIPALKKMIRSEFNDMMTQVNNRLKRA